MDAALSNAQFPIHFAQKFAEISQFEFSSIFEIFHIFDEKVIKNCIFHETCDFSNFQNFSKKLTAATMYPKNT